METITISKSKLNQILSTQEKLKSELVYLKNVVLDSLNDELDPKIIKRLEEMSVKLDNGAGKRFDSTDDVKSFLDRM